MRRTHTGRGRPRVPGGTPADEPQGWEVPGGILESSLVPDWPWASAGDEAMTRGDLRAGYGLRGRDIRMLEAAGLLSARRTWSGQLHYAATSGRLPERPRRGTRRSDGPDGRPHPSPRPRLSWQGITLAAIRGTGRLVLLVLIALGILLRPVPWWLLLAAAAALYIAAGPHTPLLAAPAGAAVIKAVTGITRAIVSTRQPPAPPPPRPGWWW